MVEVSKSPREGDQGEGRCCGLTPPLVSVGAHSILTFSKMSPLSFPSRRVHSHSRKALRMCNYERQAVPGHTFAQLNLRPSSSVGYDI